MKRLIGFFLVWFALTSLSYAADVSKTLTWDASPTPGITSHHIYRLLGPCELQGPLAFYKASGTALSFHDLIPDSEYGARYAVTAVIGTSESDKSVSACATLKAQPPSNLKVTQDTWSEFIEPPDACGRSAAAVDNAAQFIRRRLAQ